jgi:hypothetical protein
MRVLTVAFITCLVALNCYSADCYTRYFSVKLDDGVKQDELIFALNGLPSVQVDAGSFSLSPLANVLDTLYLDVSDELDIHIYDFKVNMEVKHNLQGKAYYDWQKNTLFVGVDSMRVGVLAHELAHAIILRYFVVPPPEKLQEMMCGYVEYQINKKVNHDAR